MKLMKHLLMALTLAGVAAAQTGTAVSATKQAQAAKTAVEKPSAAKEAAPKAPSPTKYSSRRDPFINPVKMQREKMASAPACTTGSRCLMTDQVVLKGIVKTQQGMIAMVENSTRKQYNLREKDPVYNGFVLRITGDSIVFRVNTTDASGRPVTREVVKTVTVPVV